MRSSPQLLLMLLLYPGQLLAQSPSFVAPSYQADVQAILNKHCTACHGSVEPKNGLNLTSRSALLRGGKTGAAVQPGSLRDSLLWSFVATNKMPAAGEKLSAAEKDTLRRWILAGAPATAQDASPASRSKLASETNGAPKLSGVAVLVERIDSRLAAAAREVQVKPAPLADDAEFHRRVFLDLNGRVPSYDETVQFLADRDPAKRAKLIDQRLAAAEFGRHQAIIWQQLLIPKSSGAYARIPHGKFRDWLAESFNSDRGWDEIVTDLLTAEGYLPSDKDNELTRKKDAKLQPQNVATAFINAHNTEGRPQPKSIVAAASRLFLAQSIECAQCHNHPQAKWEQADFWAAAAFFERVRYETAAYGDTSIGRLSEPARGKDLVYEDKGKGRYAFVKGVYDRPVIDMEDGNGQLTGALIRAKFLDGHTPELAREESYRAAFARWATSRENAYFAPALVNRLWSQLLGRGFVEPVDDMSEDNLPSQPELLAELSTEFAASEFDLKHLIRCVANSQAYQRTSAAAGDVDQAAEQRVFARQTLKQLTAEQLLASLATAVPTFAALLAKDAEDKNPGLIRQAFLDAQETEADNVTEHTRGLQQALRMMNGDGKLFDRAALGPRVTDEQAVELNITQVYLQALNREPMRNELERMSQFVAAAAASPETSERKRKETPDKRVDPYADILWVLINSGEFIFNH